MDVDIAFIWLGGLPADGGTNESLRRCAHPSGWARIETPISSRGAAGDDCLLLRRDQDGEDPMTQYECAHNWYETGRWNPEDGYEMECLACHEKIWTSPGEDDESP